MKTEWELFNEIWSSEVLFLSFPEKELRVRKMLVLPRTKTKIHLTQAVEAECSVVKEVANVAGFCRHGAKGVCTAGCEGVNTDEQHVHQEGPCVAVSQEVQSGAEDAETPKEVPGNKKIAYCSAISSHLE